MGMRSLFHNLLFYITSTLLFSIPFSFLEAHEVYPKIVQGRSLMLNILNSIKDMQESEDFLNYPLDEILETHQTEWLEADPFYQKSTHAWDEKGKKYGRPLMILNDLFSLLRKYPDELKKIQIKNMEKSVFSTEWYDFPFYNLPKDIFLKILNEEGIYYQQKIVFERYRKLIEEKKINLPGEEEFKKYLYSLHPEFKNNSRHPQYNTINKLDFWISCLKKINPQIKNPYEEIYRRLLRRLGAINRSSLFQKLGIQVNSFSLSVSRPLSSELFRIFVVEYVELNFFREMYPCYKTDNKDAEKFVDYTYYSGGKISPLVKGVYQYWMEEIQDFMDL